MAASLDDILTTQKNGVIAINGIGQTLNATLEKLYAALKPTRLYGGALPTASATTLYTAPSDKTAAITGMVIANTSAASKTISLWIVPSGATISAAHALYLAVPVAANTTVTFNGSIAVPAGGDIRGQSSGDITLTITGTVLS